MPACACPHADRGVGWGGGEKPQLIELLHPDRNPDQKSRDGTKAVAFCGQGKVLH